MQIQTHALMQLGNAIVKQHIQTWAAKTIGTFQQAKSASVYQQANSAQARINVKRCDKRYKTNACRVHMQYAPVAHRSAARDPELAPRQTCCTQCRICRRMRKSPQQNGDPTPNRLQPWQSQQWIPTEALARLLPNQTNGGPDIELHPRVLGSVWSDTHRRQLPYIGQSQQPGKKQTKTVKMSTLTQTHWHIPLLDF
jgi:hypothetical protein